jgi:26S proteasome regulatory subunit N9
LDQVSSTADITWIQPRFLEGQQLDTVAEQFDTWRSGVRGLVGAVDEKRQRAKAAVLA